MRYHSKKNENKVLVVSDSAPEETSSCFMTDGPAKQGMTQQKYERRNGVYHKPDPLPETSAEQQLPAETTQQQQQETIEAEHEELSCDARSSTKSCDCQAQRRNAVYIHKVIKSSESPEQVSSESSRSVNEELSKQDPTQQKYGRRNGVYHKPDPPPESNTTQPEEQETEQQPQEQQPQDEDTRNSTRCSEGLCQRRNAVYIHKVISTSGSSGLRSPSSEGPGSSQSLSSDRGSSPDPPQENSRSAGQKAASLLGLGNRKQRRH